MAPQTLPEVLHIKLIIYSLLNVPEPGYSPRSEIFRKAAEMTSDIAPTAALVTFRSEPAYYLETT